MCEAKRLECETIQLLPQDVGSRISAFLHEPDPLPWAPRREGKRLEWIEPLRLSRGVAPLVSGALPPAVQFAMAASSCRDTPQPAASASRGAPQPSSEACELPVGSFNFGPVRRLRAALGDDGQWLVGHWQRFVRKLLGIRLRARRAHSHRTRVWRIRQAWNRIRWRLLLRHWRVRYLL